jgi:hypothetical protein
VSGGAGAHTQPACLWPSSCELSLGRQLPLSSRVPWNTGVVLVTSYSRHLASAPKVHWQAGAGAPAPRAGEPKLRAPTQLYTIHKRPNRSRLVLRPLADSSPDPPHQCGRCLAPKLLVTRWSRTGGCRDAREGADGGGAGAERVPDAE